MGASGMDCGIGSLAPGRRAGTVSGAEPEQIAVFLANGRDVDTVLAAGRMLRQLPGVDVDSTLARRACEQRL